MIDKIKALLNLANDPAASDQERETASRQAAKMMAKYEIDEFDLMVAQNRDFDLIEGYAQGVRPGKRTPASKVPHWIGMIAMGVRLWTRTRCIARAEHVVFRGTRSSVELAQWLHNGLVAACYTASKGQSNPNAFRNGYASAIQKRLNDMANPDLVASVGVGGTSLVVFQSRLNEAMDSLWGPQKSKSLKVSKSLDGYAAGIQAHIPTNRPITTTSAGYLK